MVRIIDLALKDLTQLLRDRKTALFLVIMPVAFTLLFGFAFGGTSGQEAPDNRLPVGVLDQDKGLLGAQLIEALQTSGVIRLEMVAGDEEDLAKRVDGEDLAAALILPPEYSLKLQSGDGIPARMIVDENSNAAYTIISEVQTIINRLTHGIQTAQVSLSILESQTGELAERDRAAFFTDVTDRVIRAWQDPPIGLGTSSAQTVSETETIETGNAFAQSSPGMMAQFAIAGLLGAAGILVIERKTGSLQRLLTTNMTRAEVLLGHYLAMFVMIFVQLGILTTFGQLFLKLDYLNSPVATGLLIVSTSLMCASLGLLIGAIAKTEEQVIIFSLILMFVLSGLGGAWIPLEFTPETVRRIAFLTPVAWVMDGFKDILLRGLGLEAVLQAIGVLVIYAVALFWLAVWRFRFEP